MKGARDEGATGGGGRGGDVFAAVRRRGKGAVTSALMGPGQVGHSSGGKSSLMND